MEKRASSNLANALIGQDCVELPDVKSYPPGK
jgi:hypothetical protein